jgi:hypothetical protein
MRNYAFSGKGKIQGIGCSATDCSFRLSQSESGDLSLKIYPAGLPGSLVLLTANVSTPNHQPAMFEGSTLDGWRLQSEVVFSGVGNDPRASGTVSLDRLTLNSDIAAEKAGVTFHLTNCFLPDAEPLTITIPGLGTASITPVSSYHARVAKLTSTRRPRVTAIVHLSVPPDQAKLLADLICDALSVMTGNLVGWISSLASGPSGKCLSLINAVTKPWSNLPIDLENSKGTERNTYLRQRYANFQRCFEYLDSLQSTNQTWARSIIRIWTDGRLEQDFLQNRGLKCAATIDALTKLAIPPPHRRNVLDRINSLLNLIGHNEPSVERFIQNRHSLAHACQFYSDDYCQKHPQFKFSTLNDFEFVASLVDRIVTKTLHGA